MTQKENDILEAAVIVFAKKGFEHTSIADISNQLKKKSPGTIYYHFSSKPTKHQILLTITLRFWKIMVHEAKQTQRHIPDSIKRLRVIIFKTLTILGSNKDGLMLSKVLIQALPPASILKDKNLRSIRNNIQKNYDNFREIVQTIILEGQSQGSINPHLHPKTIFNFLYGGIERSIFGLSSRKGRKVYYSEKHIKHVIDATLKSLTP